MSIEKELKKVGDKFNNIVDSDKDERAEDCFNLVKSAKGAVCDINTKQETTTPPAGIARISLGEGNKLEYCLNELNKHGQVPCGDLPTIQATQDKQKEGLSKLEQFKSISCKDNAKIADNMVQFFKIQQDASLNKVAWDANQIIQIQTARENGNFDPAGFNIDWTQKCQEMKNIALEACKELHPDNQGHCQPSHEEL